MLEGIRRAERNLQGTILVDLISKCRLFTLSTLNAVTSSLATPGSARRAAIGLDMLRNPGTAIYISMLESEADQYVDFLTVFSRLSLSVLSAPPPFAVDYAPCLFVVDNAGRIPIPGLTSKLDRALDSEVTMVLAYRNVGEIYEHYGPREAYAILDSIKSLVFLPGLDKRTINVAAGLARWHTATYWTGRRQCKRTKAEQLAEADLFSTYEKALGELARHHHAIALVGTAPPIRFMFPPFASLVPQNRSRAVNKGMPYATDFQTEEAHYKRIHPRPEATRARSPSDLGYGEPFNQSHSSRGNEIDNDQSDSDSFTSTRDEHSLDT